MKSADKKKTIEAFARPESKAEAKRALMRAFRTDLPDDFRGQELVRLVRLLTIYYAIDVSARDWRDRLIIQLAADVWPAFGRKGNSGGKPKAVNREYELASVVECAVKGVSPLLIDDANIRDFASRVMKHFEAERLKRPPSVLAVCKVISRLSHSYWKGCNPKTLKEAVLKARFDIAADYLETRDVVWELQRFSLLTEYLPR